MGQDFNTFPDDTPDQYDSFLRCSSVYDSYIRPIPPVPFDDTSEHPIKEPIISTDLPARKRKYRIELLVTEDGKMDETVDIDLETDLKRVQEYILNRFLPDHGLNKSTRDTIHLLNGHRSKDWCEKDWILQFIICDQTGNLISHRAYCNVYYVTKKVDRQCCTIC